MSENIKEKQKLQAALDGLVANGSAMKLPQNIQLLGASLYHNNTALFNERSFNILSTGFSRAAGPDYKDFVINTIHPQRIPHIGTSIGSVFTMRKTVDCSRSAYRMDQLCYNKALNKDFAVQLIFKAPHDELVLPISQVAAQAKSLMQGSKVGQFLAQANKNILTDIATNAFVNGAQSNNKTAVLCSYDISNSTALRQTLGSDKWQKHLEATRQIADDLAQKYGGQMVRVEGDGAHIIFAAADYDCDDVLDALACRTLPYAREVLTAYDALKQKSNKQAIKQTQLRLAQAFGQTSMAEISARYGVTDYMGDAFLINRKLLDILPRDRAAIGLDNTAAQYVPEVELLRREEYRYTHFQPSCAYLF